MKRHSSGGGAVGKHLHKRRRILKAGAAVAGIAFMEGFVAGCENDTVKSSDKTYSFDISTEPILAVEGGTVIKQLGDLNGGRQVVIIRSSGKKLTVLSSVCPHQGCTVNKPDSPGGPLVCMCHSSKFSSVDGSVLQGPSTDPLTKFATSFDAEKNILTIQY